mgnify:CR=1 FL=1
MSSKDFVLLLVGPTDNLKLKNNYFYLEHNDGILLNQTLDLAIENKTSIDALQLVTWNDFGEGTMYEPTYEYGFKMLTNLQAKLGVSYSEYELQQIYRLFDLRKKYSNDSFKGL